MKYFTLLLFVCIGFSCKKNCERNYPDGIPACVTAKIEDLKNKPKGNPAYSVYQYNYNGKKVYYFPPQCCDQYSDLYDGNCNLICHPDGGLIGTGDANCKDFLTTRKNEVLIWKDNR
jgi:hypothetical protein